MPGDTAAGICSYAHAYDVHDLPKLMHGHGALHIWTTLC